MDTQSRRALTALAKSAKLVAVGKRSKIVAKAKVSPKSKRVVPEGYLVGRAKTTKALLALRPRAKAELERFRECMIERFGDVAFGLYGVERPEHDSLVVCVECDSSDKTIKRFSAAIRECSPARGTQSAVRIRAILCANVAHHIDEMNHA